jgi:hypothetical protein
MGPERSLEKLRDFCTEIGLVRALNTFKRWSVLYDWQNKILELDAKYKEERDRQRIVKVEDMNERQAQHFRNAQALAGAGMSAMAQELKRTGRLDLSPQDIMTLLYKGAQGERLAMGEATDRFEGMLYVYQVMLLAIMGIFKVINPLRDELERFRAFTTQVDELKHTKLIDYANPEEISWQNT